MWIVENKLTGIIEDEFHDEQDAWDFIMRREVNNVRGAEQMEVVEVDEFDEKLITHDEHSQS
jgi:hypothetical protein